MKELIGKVTTAGLALPCGVTGVLGLYVDVRVDSDQVVWVVQGPHRAYRTTGSLQGVVYAAEVKRRLESAGYVVGDSLLFSGGDDYFRGEKYDADKRSKERPVQSGRRKGRKTVG